MSPHHYATSQRNTSDNGSANSPPSPTFTATSSTASDQPVKRARKSRPKVKTGCNNCKQRRIKCDEIRPACTQCARSKKACPGYPPPPRGARPYEELRIAPKPKLEGAPPPPSPPIAVQPIQPGQLVRLPPRRASRTQRRIAPPPTPVVQQQCIVPTLYYRPSGNPFNEKEGLYFQLFRSHTADELSGYFDSVFWSRLVLQECHVEKAIRDAVVALGALYKTLDKTTESPPSSPTAGDDTVVDSAWQHWEVAIKYYSEAINSLFSVTGQDSRANRTRLMANILLACFDSFIGDHQQAIRQIQNGLALLEQLRVQRRRAFVSRPEEPVEDEIIQMFTRLAIQAKSYDMAFHFPKPYVIQLIQPATDSSSPSSEGGSPVSLQQDPIPEQFYSLRDARLAWDALLEKMLRFTEIQFASASQAGPMGVLPATSLREHGIGFGQQIQAWGIAFEPLLNSRFSEGVTSQEKAAIAVLKMFHIMGQILFFMTFCDSETQFDAYQPHFQAIVDLGLEVVGDEERRASKKRCFDPRTCQHQKGHLTDIFGGQTYIGNHIKPSFSADLGIVPPLYVVATKCRDPVIRRKAIQLLRSSSRREGMWDSELVARIGMWIMGIEEEEDLLLFPAQSQAGSFSDANGPAYQAIKMESTSSNIRQSNGSLDFGGSLGPGGNARWDSRPKTTISHAAWPQSRVIPESKRVMVKAVEFDLKQHSAKLQCGSRDLAAGSPDLKTRVTQLTW
ncbi:hypothetical protein SLS53_000093 [Cytospora paraplurivora]|uniref:Zn(2)-C6 fungal-type domain-containing protein n=1 Tax=Cytospora paraplurivora TaxID=2898453 RepID=A0AAN9UL43_9PEZI